MTLKKKLYKVATLDTQYCFRPNLFIWPERTLLYGPIQQLDFHAMGSIAINIGLYQPFFIQTQNSLPTPYRCAIIPAGCRHKINAFGHIMASLIIEKNSSDYYHLKNRYQFNESTITDIFDPELTLCLQKIHTEKPTKNTIESLLNQHLQINTKTTKTLDPRIAKAMKIIQLEPDRYYSQQDLATELGLSSSRFRHLFRDHTDIPFRRYKMWRRVIAAMSSLHKVDSLTYAAMEGGFTDSAHFNHCLVFKNIDRFEV